VLVQTPLLHPPAARPVEVLRVRDACGVNVQEWWQSPTLNEPEFQSDISLGLALMRAALSRHEVPLFPPVDLREETI
jgi:hypothetical protein